MNISISPKAEAFIARILDRYPTDIKLKRGRVTKYGDYRFFKPTNNHQITINRDLSPEAFLFVLIHEVAHRVCYEHFQRSVKPHGDEWKRIFSKLLFQSIDAGLFPDHVVAELSRFAKYPKSVVKKGTRLHDLFFHEEIKEGEFVLEDLQEGTEFYFRKRVYKRLEKRRTRILCEETNSKRKYLFNKSTLVRLDFQ